MVICDLFLVSFSLKLQVILIPARELTCARRMLDLPFGHSVSQRVQQLFRVRGRAGSIALKPAAAAAAVAGYSEPDGAIAVILSEVIVKC